MKTVNWTNPPSADDVLKQARRDNVLVVRDGRPVAVVMPLEDDDAEWIEREMDPAFIQSIADARKDIEEGRVVSHEEMKKQFGIP